MINSLFGKNSSKKSTLNPDYLSHGTTILSLKSGEQSKLNTNEPIFPQISDNFNFSDIGVTQCSAVDNNFWNNIKGIWKDIIDGESKDGEIGNSKQGATGDCWLLAGVNALSYTQEGKKMISDALEYKKGYTVVHTACGDYVVSDEEVRLTKADRQYSDGDDDMIIFELAVEKIIDDVANGRVSIDAEASDLLKNAVKGEQGTTTGKSSTEGGNSGGLIYILTGKMAKRYTKSEDISAQLDTFSKNGNKNFTMTCGFKANIDESGKKSSYVVKDAHGNDVELITSHAFSVKNVDDKYVTIVNPWDSSKDIVLDRETFMEYCSDVESCDLSSANPTQDYFRPKMYYNKNGDLEKSIDKDKEGNVTKYTYNYNKKGELTDINCNANYIDGRYLEYKWNADGKCTYAQNGNKDTNIALIRNYDDEGNITNVYFGELDSNGGLKYTFTEMNSDIADRILDNDMLSYEQLSAQDIFSLAKNLNDTQLDKAIDYLKQHPNATYQEVMNNID
ncbi:MAG: hypothetical protein E7Z88_02235 [Cyanobacteria bacterium SIG27]|nr:hypothetical protein [Cyanobacteria bacterium SIG27]